MNIRTPGLVVGRERHKRCAANRCPVTFLADARTVEVGRSHRARTASRRRAGGTGRCPPPGDDDTFVEHDLDLLGHRRQRTVAHLVGGEERPAWRGCRRRRTGRGRPRASSRRRAARRPARRAAEHERGDIGRPSGSRALSATSNDVPSSTALVTSPRNRVRTRLTMNAGASLTSTHDFLSFLPTAKAVASVGVVGRRARTISSSGRTATGLKKWKPTTRSGCSSLRAISVTDSDEVLVARMQRGTRRPRPRRRPAA